ncbi:MAG: hypothetical protein M1511_16025 [Deltaproteobacteria bacterium]|nr:hypothetical protein [Deltaproteobacteria bacterium]
MMRRLILMVTLVALLGAALPATASDRSFWRLQKRYQEEVAEQKKRDAAFKAIEDEADKLFQHENKHTVKPNKNRN